MTAFRDSAATGAHPLKLDGVVLHFDAESVLSNPTPAQERVLTATPVRRARFVRSTSPAAAPVRARRSTAQPPPAAEAPQAPAPILPATEEETA